LAPQGIFSPDGKLLLLVYDYKAGIGPGFDGPPPNYHRLCLFDTLTGKQIQAFDGPYYCDVPHFCSDGKTLLMEELYGPLQLWDARNGKRIRSFDDDSKGLLLLALSPAAPIGFVGHPSRGLELWDVNAGKSLRALESMESRGNIRRGIFSPDGKRVFAIFARLEEGGIAAVWDVASGGLRLTFQGGEEWKYPLAFAPEGTLALSDYVDQGRQEQPRLVLWDWADGKEVRRLDPRPAYARVVAFTSDGKFAVSIDSDGMMRRWGLDSGKEQAHFSLGKAFVEGCNLTKDGRKAFTSSGRQRGSGGSTTLSIDLWDTMTGKVLHGLPGSESP
jgi:WD40 repeat protein